MILPLPLQGAAEVAHPIGSHVAKDPKVGLGLLHRSSADSNALRVPDRVQQRRWVEKRQAGSILGETVELGSAHCDVEDLGAGLTLRAIIHA